MKWLMVKKGLFVTSGRYIQYHLHNLENMHTTIFCLLSLIAKSLAVGDWRPVGQEDPLNDPTNVYSPPQVAHVHYWLKAPSFDLEPPPTRATDLSQITGWPQISSHFQPISHPESSSTTPVSITTDLWLATRNTPPALSPIPTWGTSFQMMSDPFSTETPTKTSLPIFYPLPQIVQSSSTRQTTTTPVSSTPSVTPTPPTQPTSSSTHPPPPPVSFVIEGHSKVKTYGPLPETLDSIHSINHNHLTSTKKQTIFDLFNL